VTVSFAVTALIGLGLLVLALKWLFDAAWLFLADLMLEYLDSQQKSPD